MASEHAGAPSRRLREIDILRGLVIVVMALDHVRDYFNADAFRFDPLDFEQTSPALYATRWITHLCAPVFVFLAGVSAFLQSANGKSTPRLSAFLLTRGLWLIVLEATVLSFGWSFGVPFPLFLQVIWAIGWSMVALAALVWLPRLAVLAVGVIILGAHNLLDPINPEMFGAFSWVWQAVHEGGYIMTAEGAPLVMLSYPILPWIGVIAVGYGLGSIFLEPPARRDRTLVTLALGMLALFVLLRGLNLYGDSNVWAQQADLTATIMDFFNVSKYPPSLLFVLVTLGLALLVFPALARLRGPAAHVLAVFGAAPLFFYGMHVYLVHALSIGVHAAAGRDYGGLLGYFQNVFVHYERFADVGFSLAWTYVAWLAVVALLYLPCRWWAGLKARRRDWWLSYL